MNRWSQTYDVSYIYLICAAITLVAQLFAKEVYTLNEY